MYMKDGGSRAWHYDGSDFVVTLLLQQCLHGGEFEWAPFIRGQNGEENFEQVDKLFRGLNSTAKTSRAGAGALALFNGRRSMHRVRAVYGPQIKQKNSVRVVIRHAPATQAEAVPSRKECGAARGARPENNRGKPPTTTVQIVIQIYICTIVLHCSMHLSVCVRFIFCSTPRVQQLCLVSCARHTHICTITDTRESSYAPGCGQY